MTYERYTAWKAENGPILNDDTTDIITEATDRQEDRAAILDALADLECYADNERNRDSFRAAFTAIHDAARALDRLKWDYDKLSRKYDELEQSFPRKCEKCGMYIVDGLNGCTMAGSICFSCRPWNMRAVVKSYDFPPAYSVEDLDAAENRCLDMGGPMPD